MGDNLDEKKPLLSSPTSFNPPVAGEEPPPYEQPAVPTSFVGPTTNGTDTSAELPPPYSTVGGSGGAGQTMFVQCRVCQNVIHVSSETQTRVVKCTNCREATPIAPPPEGKKYVRCPCNCLLTCSATASRVVCPRENCKRTIGVGTIDIRPVNTDRIRVECGKCHKSILWPANAAVARCPHCRSRSYLYSSWMRYRALFCLVIGLLFIALAIGLTGGMYAWARDHGGIYVVWVGLFISGVGFLIRAGFYFAMTQSRVEH